MARGLRKWLRVKIDCVVWRFSEPLSYWAQNAKPATLTGDRLGGDALSVRGRVGAGRCKEGTIARYMLMGGYFVISSGI